MNRTVQLLNKGDNVISVTDNLIAIKRKSGDVDILRLMDDGISIRVDMDNVLTITGDASGVVKKMKDDVVVIDI